MAKEICISSTPHETRLAILEDDQLAEIYYERENEYTLAGSIYKGRVTRVLPGMQSAFVDVGLERDAFLYVTDFLEEQEEDSEEFDSGAANGGGRKPRESRDSREQREQRSRPQENGGEMSASEVPAPRGDRDRGRDQDRGPRDQDQGGEGGGRRWQGRRGRRFGGRGPRSDQRSDRSESRSDQRPDQRPDQRSEQRFLDSPEIVAEAISAEPVARPERGAPGGIPAQNLPIVLPGESLSKYGSRSESKSSSTAAPARTPAPARASSFKPSTMVEVPTGWDGGATLPGETLSRHRRSESRGGNAQPAPTENWAAEPAVATPAPEESAVAVVPAPENVPVENLETVAPPVPETVVSHPDPVEHATETVAPRDSEVETVEEVHEYEPEDAAASHRVETPRSEFRFAPPEVEVEEVVEEQLEEPGALATHQPETTSESETAATSVNEPLSPEGEVVRQLFGYAPGMGVLEEETIDEDEYDFEPIPGQPDEHMTEELEEETLDQASTLGDAVRDVHIEKRLGYGSPAEASEEEDTDDELETDFAESEEDEEGDDEFSETDVEEEHAEESATTESGEPAANTGAPARREDRRFGRRGGRGGRPSSGGRRHGGRRPSMQTSNLPIISELLKQGQEILVQIAKEPIARKGARITSHIALPGRFLVFMPTVNHVGVSRKIDSDEERQRLKRVLIGEKGNAPGGFIVRTAAESASDDDLRADIRFLINLWTEIKQRSDAAKAPALIYHDLNLVERILRDQVSDNFATIWVDSETEYERIVRFLNRFQPSLVRRVKLYTKETPLFEQFGIHDEISKALKSKVWLKSGGSIVINQTEALVAIDINTGKYVGKTARLEDTILRTNLDAIPEIVRQIRLRDLGGIIVIDFIDMDERRNRQKVTQALEDALKADRAPSKVLQFNDFGLVAITRKRVKQSLERTLSVPCPVCTGTGMVKSPTTVANELYTEMRKMMQHFERGDVMLRVHPEVVKVLKANNAKWLNELEEMIGKTILVKSDPALPPEQFDIQG
ncbi:MAG TPA: Rne/Rng family ribonuclease [Acidobacteriaceae bacterium]|jgi:ribonuclease G|nr:Rne/Rng family ribonuclease [Acidobacteriaceae bacterium]